MKVISYIPMDYGQFEFSELLELSALDDYDPQDLYVPMCPFPELVLFKYSENPFRKCDMPRGIFKKPTSDIYELKLNKVFDFVVIRLNPTFIYQTFGNNWPDSKEKAFSIKGINVFEELHECIYLNDGINEATIKMMNQVIQNNLKNPISDSTEILLHQIPKETISPIYSIFQEFQLDQNKAYKIFNKEVGLSPKQYQKIWRELKLESFFSQRSPHVALEKTRFILKKRIAEMEFVFRSPFASLAYMPLRDSIFIDKRKK